MKRVVGLISDTHGLLRPEALAALAGVDALIHAGDVGRAELLAPLRRVAPLTVVRGNVDRGAWAEALPQTAELALDGHWIHVRHIVDELDLDPAAAGFAAVVYGHSHRPAIERRDGVLFVNPGSAGPRRFSLPVSVARLTFAGNTVAAQIVELDV